jgi:zinc transporter 1/2/3
MQENGTRHDFSSTMQENGSGTTASIKITALFLILLSSLLGVLPPLLQRQGSGKGSDPSSTTYILRSFTAGLLLALAFVHLMQEGFEKLNGLAGDYPIASVLGMSGVLVMFITERVALDCFANSEHAHVHSHSLSLSLPERSLHNCCGQHAQSLPPNRSKALSITPAEPRLDSLEEGLLQDNANSSSAIQDEEIERVDCVGGREVARVGHYISNGNDTPAALLEKEGDEVPEHTRLSQDTRSKNKGAISLNMLELGIVVHSVVIGVDLGVSTSQASSLMSLVIALCCHQFFEGIGLGVCISNAMHPGHISKGRVITMVAWFACTQPAGILLGMLLESSYNESSTQESWITGVRA